MGKKLLLKKKTEGEMEEEMYFIDERGKNRNKRCLHQREKVRDRERGYDRCLHRKKREGLLEVFRQQEIKERDRMKCYLPTRERKEFLFIIFKFHLT